MLATILGVLGRSNQPALAQEIFSRAEPELGNCVQVRRSSCVVVFFSLFTELLARCNKALLLLLLLTIRVFRCTMA
jgi:hypothetical protein